MHGARVYNGGQASGEGSEGFESIEEHMVMVSKSSVKAYIFLQMRQIFVIERAFTFKVIVL